MHSLALRLGIILILNLKQFSCQFINDDHTQSQLDPDGDESYLRLIFDNGTEYYYRHWECPDGIWADDFFEKNPPKCACVKGAFAISKGLCDEEFEILTGNEHCYDISKSMIRKFTPLTGPSGLGGRANTVFRKDAPYFARLISPTPKNSVNEPVHYLFRLNDPRDFSVYASLPDGTAARLACFKAQAVGKNGSTADAVMQVAELPSCANEFHGPQSWCGADIDFGNYLTTIKLGTKWGPKSSGAGTKYPGGCSGGNVGGKGRRFGRRRRAEPKGRENTPNRPKCTEFDPSVIERPVQGQSPPIEYFVDRKEYPVDHPFHTTSLHQTEVNDQTTKIVNDLMDIHLGTEELKRTKRVKIQEPNKIPAFRYVQLARLIMEKICPQEYVPSFVLSFMTRVFRLIFLDVSQKYPYPEILDFNSTTNKEILTALTTCKEKIPQNISMFLPNETCHDAGIIGTNLTDSTAYLYGVNLSSIPSYIKFDPSTMDLPLETMWKMMLLVHYYCAPNFTNPLYHSEFAVKYEAFFRNPTVLFRWYHPGPANSVFKLILSAFNLKEFAASVDRCVTTANAMSEYKGWLHRPADTLKWKSKFQIRVNVPSVQNNTNTKIRPTTVPHSGRRKRYYFQNNFWDEKAYCLRNSKAIVTEVQSSSAMGCRSRPVWFQNTD